MAKFNGMPGEAFYLHFKETEFRYNHRRDNLYLAVLNPLYS